MFIAMAIATVGLVVLALSYIVLTKRIRNH